MVLQVSVIYEQPINIAKLDIEKPSDDNQTQSASYAHLKFNPDNQYQNSVESFTYIIHKTNQVYFKSDVFDALDLGSAAFLDDNLLVVTGL